MQKRSAAIFAVFIFLFGLSILRVVSVGKSDYASAGNSVSTRTVILAQSRGKIYDINGDLLVDRKSKTVAAVKPTVAALTALKKLLSSSVFKSVEQRIMQGYPVNIELPYNPYNNDITAFNAPVRYDGTQTASHIIGYLDSSGTQGLYGIEKSYNELLAKNSGQLSVSYQADAKGRVLTGTAETVSDEGFNSKGGVVLTIDREIQQIVEAAMDNNGLESGAAVVLKADTGAVAALVSRPGFDPTDVAASLNADNSPMLNKALCAYSVGSVFKPIVAAAALENDSNISFACVCNGGIQVGDTYFRCHLQEGHGHVDMQLALTKSCNVYFVELAKLINREYLISLCENLGFSQSLKIADGFVSEAGILASAAEIKNAGDYANLSFGQGKLSASPLQLAAAYLALVGGGQYRYPYMLQGTLDSGGKLTESQQKAPSRVISAETSARIRELLTAAVEAGSPAKPFLTTAGGKTATAQSGIYENGDEICRTWFAGFFPADKPEYIAVILKENGTSGTEDCAPIFRQLADDISVYESAKSQGKSYN